jgi:hypothetical protein
MNREERKGLERNFWKVLVKYYSRLPSVAVQLAQMVTVTRLELQASFSSAMGFCLVGLHVCLEAWSSTSESQLRLEPRTHDSLE